MLRHYADIARRIIGYFLALALTVVFALFMSARTGWFLFSVMVLIPAVSVSMTLIMKKYITVTAEVSETELYKGNSAELRVIVKNSGLFPSPPVILRQWCSDGLEASDESSQFAVNVMPLSQGSFETEYKAVLWCYARIGLEDAYLTDYTGMLKFRLPGFTNEGCSFDVKIIPDIKNISSSQEMLKTADDAASRNDDSEDTADTRALGFTGVPGYEHRGYEPGDPLKRVNWKLSAKRNSLMVRLDDRVLSKKHSVILDGVNFSGNAKKAELCAETMLGVLAVIIRSGFESRVWYRSGGVWNETEVNDEMSLEQLRLGLAGYRFEEKIPDRIPYDQLADMAGGAGAVLFFTPDLDAQLSEQLVHSGIYSKTDITVTAAAAAAESGTDVSGVWFISDDGSIEMI